MALGVGSAAERSTLPEDSGRSGTEDGVLAQARPGRLAFHCDRGAPVLGSARFERADFRILRKRTSRVSHVVAREVRRESLFRQNAETSTLQACAPQAEQTRRPFDAKPMRSFGFVILISFFSLCSDLILR